MQCPELYRKKQTFPIETIRNSTVIFTFGQSKAANYGQECYSPKNKGYNYYDGKVYEGKDPLVEPTGTGGIVWTRVADMMIDSGISESVTIVPIAVGTTNIKSWTEGGNLYEMFTRSVDQMLANGIVPDCIFWHQGESDNIANTTESFYIKKFESIRKVFKDRGIDAPIYIAVASYYPQCIKSNNGICNAVRRAQIYLIKNIKIFS